MQPVFKVQRGLGPPALRAPLVRQAVKAQLVSKAVPATKVVLEIRDQQEHKELQALVYKVPPALRAPLVFKVLPEHKEPQALAYKVRLERKVSPVPLVRRDQLVTKVYWGPPVLRVFRDQLVTKVQRALRAP